MYLRRALDDEGEILDVVVQRRRDTKAALKLIRRLLRNQPVKPETIITDGLASYGAEIYNTFNIQRHLISRTTLRRFRVELDTACAAAAV